MVDKTFTANANPLFFDGAIVNGLFRWTDAGAAVKNKPVRLKAVDGPPIDVGAMTAVDQQFIGVVLEGGAATNDQVVVLTPYSAIIGMTVGTGGSTRGSKQKTLANGDITDALLGDVGTGATGATETRVVGVALQSGAAADIIYVGISQ